MGARLDRARFRGNRRCWAELDPITYLLVGYRRMGRRTLLGSHVLEVYPARLPVGEEIRT